LKKIKALTDTALIVVALLVVGLLIHRYIPFDHSAHNASAKAIHSGQTLDLEALGFKKVDRFERVLFLVVKTDCGFCDLSTPFYRLLQSKHEVGGLSVELVGVFPDPQTAVEKWLHAHRLDLRTLTGASLASILRVKRVPTLILADSTGRVIDVWTGRLAAEQREEVLRRVSK
jgi:hypothetical protein